MKNSQRNHPARAAIWGCVAFFTLCMLTTGCEGDGVPRQTGCDPAQANSCLSNTMVCVQDTCLACGGTALNCDGINSNGCEGGPTCSSAPACDMSKPHSCPQLSQTCVAGSCNDCPGNTLDCDGLAVTGCEGSGDCGAACQVSTTASTCGQDSYCGGTSCLPCSQGRKNCDADDTNGCEGSNDCSSTACEDHIDNSCDVSTKYCLDGKCVDCAGGSKNCNGKNDDACETTDCTATACKVADYDSCKTEDQYCVCADDTFDCEDGTCQPCDMSGTKNCDGLNTNRCEAGGCGCDDEVNDSCGSVDKYCIFGECEDCSDGQKNCNGDNEDGCETPAALDCGVTVDPRGSDTCPASGDPVTASETIQSATSAQDVGDQCSMTNPYGQVFRIQTTQPDTRLIFQLSTPDDTELAMSLRSECTIDHGCSWGFGSRTYERTVEAGTYNLVVSTAEATSFTLAVVFTTP